MWFFHCTNITLINIFIFLDFILAMVSDFTSNSSIYQKLFVFQRFCIILQVFRDVKIVHVLRRCTNLTSIIMRRCGQILTKRQRPKTIHFLWIAKKTRCPHNTRCRFAAIKKTGSISVGFPIWKIFCFSANFDLSFFLHYIEDFCFNPAYKCFWGNLSHLHITVLNYNAKNFKVLQFQLWTNTLNLEDSIGTTSKHCTKTENVKVNKHSSRN